MRSIFARYLIGLFSLTFSIAIATNVIATPVNLVERAMELYQQGKYFASSELWQQAVSYFEQKQDPLNRVMALSNLALTQQKIGNISLADSTIDSALKIIQSQPLNTTRQRVLANSLDIKGSTVRSQGQSEIALSTWQKAEKIYRELNSEPQSGSLQERAMIKNQVNQAQALQDLGYYRRANKLLSSVVDELNNQADSADKVTALLGLGNTLRTTGNLEKSLEVLKQAATIAKKSGDTKKEKLVLLSLGNTVYRLENRLEYTNNNATNFNSIQCLADNNLLNKNSLYLQAVDCYQQAKLSNNLATKTKAQLNLLSLIIRDRVLDSQSLPDLITEITTNLNQLPTTRSTIYDRLNLVQSLICLQPDRVKYPSPLVQQCTPREDNLISWTEIETQANLARQQAQQLQDKQAEAYASGYLGAIDLQMGKLAQALKLTRQAILNTDSNFTSESAYLWQWQLGRIYQAEKQQKLARESYHSAFDSLQSLRDNLLATNPTTQFAFRDRIEPLYRERVALLLDNNPSQANLIAARDTIEALQLAQLNNFFREACIDAKPQNIENIDPNAAVIYSIILRDRLTIILSQSGQPLRYYQTQITPQAIERVFADFYVNLSPYLAISDPLQPNQTIYNWLIRPLETQLQQNQTKTLVFILDGALSSIPLAALHDGKQYLVEKYNLALTPGLQLFASSPFTPQNIRTIAGGLTASRQGFSPLPNVETEVTQIASLVPSEILLDRDFTRDKLRSQINSQPYPVVHLATHGQFSSRAEDTFLLTWSDRINVKDLDLLLQDRDFTQNTPIELLILSACQTATGDKQAALGLAGVAVRSGARSTIATLWSIQDDSTAQLMTEFYQALTTSETKAQALRKAQLKLLYNPKYEHPFYWSAFVLVGNWL